MVSFWEMVADFDQVAYITIPVGGSREHQGYNLADSPNKRQVLWSSFGAWVGTLFLSGFQFYEVLREIDYIWNVVMIVG